MNPSHAARRLSGPLGVVAGLYFFVFMAEGAYNPFINLYYSRLGFSGVEIGVLAAAGVLVGTVTAFFWAALADGYRLHNRILHVTLLLSPFAILLILFTDRFEVILGLVALFSFISNPILSLLDSSALEQVKLHDSSYGAMRVWGSVGWSISTWLVGWLIQSSGIHWLFYSFAALCLVTFLLSLRLPPRVQVVRSSLGEGLSRLASREKVAFLASVFILSATSSAVSSFLSIYLDRIGAGEALIGLNWTLAALSEIPLMFYSGALIARFGARQLVGASFILYALRWLLYSFIQEPALVVAVGLIGGFSFALFLTSGIAYMTRRVPPSQTTTAMLVYYTVSFGLASIAGSMCGGWLFDQLGMQALFRIVTVLSLAGFAIFALGPRGAPEQAAPAIAGE